MPISAVIVAAVLTGSGGGIVRDLLARRKPLVLRDEIYGVWAALAGLMIGLEVLTGDLFLYGLFGIITVLRIFFLYEEMAFAFTKAQSGIAIL